jgi:peptide-methionine (S)-S-oxide reductase
MANTRQKSTYRTIAPYIRPAVLTVFGVLAIGLVARSSLSSAEEVHAIPAPVVDETAAAAPKETAIFAGGCFWGVQGVFQHVDGVLNAVSGYTGGEASTAKYREVGTGATGHAESVRITYDPHKISYGRLMQIYFSVAHDPTELNRQGPDSGTQYRSAIFPVNDDQAKLARAYIAQLNAAHAYGAAIVTKIKPGKTFYPAEDYHQDFLTQNPTYPYIVYNDLPKVAALKEMFPKLYRPDPVLVATNGVTN